MGELLYTKLLIILFVYAIVELIISISIGIIFLLLLILLSKYPIIEYLIDTDVKKAVKQYENN